MSDQAPAKPPPEPPPAPGEPAERAVRRLLKTQWTAMTAELPRLLSPDDPEPLHDFRVAHRRARSLLKELGDALPARPVAQLITELEWLGAATGPSRDLDVLTAGLEARARTLPEAVARDLSPMFALLSEDRLEARAQLAEVEASERLKRLLAALGQLAERRPRAARAGSTGRRLTVELAAERLAQAGRRVVKRGRVIGPQPQPEDLHRLRIACKRLRYLLEFFHSLFPPRQVAARLKDLRRLQDLLGVANDLAVGQERLRELARRLPGVEAVLAVGFLLAVLEAERREIEAEIRPALSELISRRNQERLRRLYA